MELARKDVFFLLLLLLLKKKRLWQANPLLRPSAGFLRRSFQKAWTPPLNWKHSPFFLQAFPFCFRKTLFWVIKNGLRIEKSWRCVLASDFHDISLLLQGVEPWALLPNNAAFPPLLFYIQTSHSASSSVFIKRRAPVCIFCTRINTLAAFPLNILS